MKELINKLICERTLTEEEFASLIDARGQVRAYAIEQARQTALRSFGNKIYIRGLIEMTNYCKNDCYYCGIRRSNRNCARYRLTQEDILACCDAGYPLGFRTFVLQGGEDGAYSDADLCAIVSAIKARYPDCAVTLSLGERSRESYQRLYDAGADRYLLRHETADEAHYARLHPASLSLANRKRCLYNLKEIGYQVGSGFMVGSPYQTSQNLAADLCFIRALSSQMVGIGPFIPHHDTPFAAMPGGSLELTVFLLALLRLMLPHALIPATTALATISPDGRKQGILAGANVIMPNLSPADTRKDYSLYDNKACMGEEAAEGLAALKAQMREIGYEIVCARGDYEG